MKYWARNNYMKYTARGQTRETARQTESASSALMVIINYNYYYVINWNAIIVIIW